MPIHLQGIYFYQQYYGQLFGVKTLNAHNVSQALCLPVSIDELLQSHKNKVFIALLLSVADTSRNMGGGGGEFGCIIQYYHLL
jgi:hypothetical protein